MFQEELSLVIVTIMARINYFDLGLHRNANELCFMLNHICPLYEDHEFNLYGFEAHSEYTTALQEKFKEKKNVQIVNIALSDTEGEIPLYLDNGDGVGNSIFRTKANVTSKFKTVPCTRLSVWIKKNNIEVQNAVNLLKINIEGAELRVFEDLFDAGLNQQFKIFLGHVGDVRKCSELKELIPKHDTLVEELSRYHMWIRDMNLKLIKTAIDKELALL